jgi:hypothetical protein
MEADMAYTTREESLIYSDTQAEALRCMDSGQYELNWYIC